MIDIYKQDYELDNYSTDTTYFRKLFEAVAGYGLGASSVALFSRLGGGMFEVAASCGAELVGKV
jgi:Na+/H+-translocating membrane pyrophosphatase